MGDLTKGKDEALKKLAEDDLAGTNPAALADSWFGLLKKEPAAKERVTYWYGKAWPLLAGIDKEKVRERLARLYVPLVPGKPVLPPPGWGGPVDPVNKLEGSTTCVHSGGAAARLTPGKNAKNACFLKSPEIQVPKGNVLVFSAWVLSDGTDKADVIRCEVKASDGKPFFNEPLQIPLDTPLWVRLEKQIDLKGAEASANIEVGVFSSKGVVWVDDLSLKVDGRELIRGGSFESP